MITVFNNTEMDTQVNAAVRASSALAATWIANRKAERDALYGVLEIIYTVANKAAGKTEEAQAKRDAMNAYIEAHGISVNERTSLYAKVAKIVFFEATQIDVEQHDNSWDEVSYFDDKKLSTYARVMKVAKEQKIKSSAFKAWLVGQGGISAVLNGNTKASNASEKMAEHIAKAQAYLLEVAAIDTALGNNLALNENELRVLIVRGGANNTAEIVDEIKDNKTHYVLNTVLAHYGKHLAELEAEAKKQAERAAKQEAEHYEMAECDDAA